MMEWTRGWLSGRLNEMEDRLGKLIVENMRAIGELVRTTQVLVDEIRAIRADMRSGDDWKEGGS